MRGGRILINMETESAKDRRSDGDRDKDIQRERESERRQLKPTLPFISGLVSPLNLPRNVDNPNLRHSSHHPPFHPLVWGSFSQLRFYPFHLSSSFSSPSSCSSIFMFFILCFLFCSSLQVHVYCFLLLLLLLFLRKLLPQTTCLLIISYRNFI